MKKVLLATAAVILMTGCSQNEEFENEAKQVEIGFNPIVKNSVRAAIMDKESLKAGFRTYAYNLGSEGTGTLAKPVFGDNGIEVKYVIDRWKYEGTYYWPEAAKVKFFAYAPSTSTAAKYTLTTPATDSTPKITYTVPVEASQEDLVIAQTVALPYAESGVPLTFTHALTQVNFSAKGEDALTYNLTSIQIQGVANEGTYTFGSTWAPVTGKTSGYTYPIGTTPVVIANSATKLLDQTNGALMLLPQEFAAASQAKILVSYTVTDASNNTIYTATDKEVALAETTAWGIGKKMRYTLTLTNSAKSISFGEPTVDPWNSTEVEETLPKP